MVHTPPQFPLRQPAGWESSLPLKEIEGGMDALA
jgi:hypothetical protein